MLKLYDNNLIGYYKTGVSEFGDFGFDTKEWYDINFKSQSKNWKYLNDTVTYNRNSTGHRSNEFNSTEPYLLFAGCSLTVGSAVKLEETYPYLVAKKYNINYYNLAVEGAGIDLVCYNIATWLDRNPKPVKIIVQWPEVCRSFRVKNKDVIPFGLWSDTTLKNNKELKKDLDNFNSVVHTDYFNHFGDMLKLTTRNLCKTANIELIEIDKFLSIDYGRDLKHPGTNSHSALALEL